MWNRKCFGMISGLALSLSSLAQDNNPTFKAKDWIFEKKIWAPLSGEVCIASTQKIVEQKTWTLSWIFDPGQGRVPTLVIRTDETSLPDRLPLRSDASKTKFILRRSQHLDAGNTTFWFAPVELPQLYKQVRRDSSLKLNYEIGNQKKSVIFSLSGSMKVLDEVRKNCFAGAELLPEDFFAYLDKIKASSGQVNVPLDALTLWEHVQKAWEEYRQSGVHAASLKTLDTQMKAPLEEEKKALARSGLLTQDIQQKTQEKTQLENKNTDLRQRKTQLESDLRQKEVALEAALADLKQKQDLYSPVAERARPYLDTIQAERQELSSARSDLDRAESDLSHWKQVAQSQRSQYESCRSGLGNANSDVDQARRSLDNAEAALRENEYDVRIDIELARDSTLSSLNYELRRASDEADRADDAVERQNHVLARLRFELGRCRANCRADLNPGTDELSFASFALGRCKPGDVFCGGKCHSSVDKCPGGRDDDPDRPRPRPRPPHTPPPPPMPSPSPFPPPPSCSCSALESQEDQATREYDSLINQARYASDRVASVEDSINRRRAEIQEAVLRNVRHYEEAVQEAVRALDRASDRVEDLRQCVDQSNAEVRRAESQIPSAEREVSRAEDQVSRSTRQLEQAENAFASFRQSNGYDQKKAAFEAAYQNVEGLRSGLAQTDATIRQTTDTLARNVAKIAALQSQLDQLVADIARNSDELRTIETQLAPMKAEKARLGDLLQKAQAALLAEATDFKNGLDTGSDKETFRSIPENISVHQFYEWL